MRMARTVTAWLLVMWPWAVGAQQPAAVVASDEPPALRNLRVVPPSMAHVARTQRQDNKRIVLQWHYEFFDLGHFRQAADKYMVSDFRQHDPDEASGREAYVAEFEHNGYVPRPAAQRPAFVSVMADGDWVMTVIPAQSASPGPAGEGFIHCNLYRVQHGRITDMWVSADAARPPPAH